MTASQPANTGGNPLFTVKAEAVPVLISIYKVRGAYRIQFGRGIGWDPTIYANEKDALKKLMSYKTYTKAEATIAKSLCKKNL